MGKHTKTVAIVLILVTIALVYYFSGFAIEKLQNENEQLYGEHLKLLSGQARVLISKSSIRPLRDLLNSYVSEDGNVRFCYIMSGGKSFLHTFQGELPPELLSINEGLADEITISSVIINDIGEFKVVSLLLGFGSSTIHLGIVREAIEVDIWSSSLLPLALPLAVVALAALILVFTSLSYAKSTGTKRSFTRKIPKMRRGARVKDEISIHAPCGLLLVDPLSETVRFANDHAARLFLIPVSDLISRSLDDLLYSSDPINLETARNLKIAGCRGSVYSGDGGKTPVFINTSIVVVQKEELIIVSLVDLSSQRDLEDRYKRAYAQQETLANRDKLTTLFNRRALSKHAEAELNRAERGEDLSITILDIDHFKQFNDTYGHNVGDVVLQAVANSLEQMLRPYDWLGRWGGEEFIIILPGTGLNTAARVADRIRTKVENTKVRLKGYEPLQVTVSFGVVSTTRDSGNTFQFEKLVELADKALYFSKNSGRNRVSVYFDGETKLVGSDNAQNIKEL